MATPLDHVREALAHGVDDPVQVDVQDVIEYLVVEGADRAQRLGDTGVGDRYVEAAELRQGGLDSEANRVLVSDVTAYREGALADRSGRGRGRGRAAFEINERYRSSAGVQRPRCLKADASRSTRDQGNASVDLKPG